MPRGYQTEGDVLVSHSSDNVPLDDIWEEIRVALNAWNSERTSIASLLSQPTIATASALPQGVGTTSFEKASEFGVPKAAGSKTALPVGFGFDDFDLRQAFTWKFLRSATAEQIKSVANEALSADAKLVNGTVMQRIFDPTEGLSPEGHRIFGLWSGDGVVPPSFRGQTYTGSETHYLVTGATQIDSQDLELMFGKVRGKGYTGQLVILASPTESEYISSFRAGVESRSGGPIAKYSFIPSGSAPAFIQEGTLIGSRAPSEYEGIPVSGSYGPAWLLTSYYIPTGYVCVAATAGANSQYNAVGLRSHTNPAYRGLRQIAGNGPYPLQDSFFQRSFGVGVRHRGAAVVAQVKASGDYDIPVFDL